MRGGRTNRTAFSSSLNMLTTLEPSRSVQHPSMVLPARFGPGRGKARRTGAADGHGLGDPTIPPALVAPVPPVQGHETEPIPGGLGCRPSRRRRVRLPSSGWTPDKKEEVLKYLGIGIGR